MATIDPETSRQNQCHFRTMGSCTALNHQLGWKHGLPLNDCDRCWSAGGVNSGVVEVLKDEVVSYFKKNPPSTPVVLTVLRDRHMTPEEKEAFDKNPVVAEIFERPRRWSKVKTSWQKAASFGRSLSSRGLTNRTVSLDILEKRRRSCGLVPGSEPCPSLRTSKDGKSHFCGDCGCGDTSISKLDGEGYTKLHYPFLMCPRGRDGFSNEQVDDSAVLDDQFDRVVVVNLDTRPERMEAFAAELAKMKWPLSKRPLRFRAVQGSLLPLPEGWPSGHGAWGCMRSHTRILEDCILDGLTSVLIFEDDALFPPTFVDDFNSFMEDVPSDWEGLMLGGQHLASPLVVGSGVVRCQNTGRTHAYAVRGRLLKDLYKKWVSWKPEFRTGHCDHLFQGMMSKYRVYAPSNFIVYQRQSRSDINGRVLPNRSWNPPPKGWPIYIMRCDYLTMTHLVAENIFAGDLSEKGEPTLESVLSEDPISVSRLHRLVQGLSWAANSLPSAVPALWSPRFSTEPKLVDTIVKLLEGRTPTVVVDAGPGQTRRTLGIGIEPPTPEQGDDNGPRTV